MRSSAIPIVAAVMSLEKFANFVLVPFSVITIWCVFLGRTFTVGRWGSYLSLQLLCPGTSLPHSFTASALKCIPHCLTSAFASLPYCLTASLPHWQTESLLHFLICLLTTSLPHWLAESLLHFLTASLPQTSQPRWLNEPLLHFLISLLLQSITRPCCAASLPEWHTVSLLSGLARLIAASLH